MKVYIMEDMFTMAHSTIKLCPPSQPYLFIGQFIGSVCWLAFEPPVGLLSGLLSGLGELLSGLYTRIIGPIDFVEEINWL
jgi:hypothetical protein